MVVMNKHDYMDRVLTLLTDNNTYKSINKDPTSRLRNRLITTLKDIKQQGGLSDVTYRKLCPTSAVPQSVMIFPKFTKQATPLDPLCPVEVHYLWGGKGVGRHHPPLGRPVTTPHQKHTTLCPGNTTSQTGTRGGHGIL